MKECGAHSPSPCRGPSEVRSLRALSSLQPETVCLHWLLKGKKARLPSPDSSSSYRGVVD